MSDLGSQNRTPFPPGVSRKTSPLCNENYRLPHPALPPAKMPFWLVFSLWAALLASLALAICLLLIPIEKPVPFQVSPIHPNSELNDYSVENKNNFLYFVVHEKQLSIFQSQNFLGRPILFLSAILPDSSPRWHGTIYALHPHSEGVILQVLTPIPIPAPEKIEEAVVYLKTNLLFSLLQKNSSPIAH